MYIMEEEGETQMVFGALPQLLLEQPTQGASTGEHPPAQKRQRVHTQTKAATTNLPKVQPASLDGAGESPADHESLSQRGSAEWSPQTSWPTA